MQSCRILISVKKLPKIPRRTYSIATLSNKRNGRMNWSTSQISMATVVLNQCFTANPILHCRKLSTDAKEDEVVDLLTFERVCEETLDSLTEYFEELVEGCPHLNSADVTYSSGVLTVSFGPPYGTYVINRQSPNRQIWLSSPSSGPKRYDYVVKEGYWVYKHNGQSLHRLLQEEIPEIVKTKVDFSKCFHSLV